ncbi:MAG: hypothetical protein RR382_01015 [Tannerellaceae bacterium]
MKAAQLLINSKLPENLRDYTRDYSSDSLNDLLVRVKREYPDKFTSIMQDIVDIGRNETFDRGETITIDDLDPVFDKQQVFDKMDAEIAASKAADPQHFQKNRREIWQKYNEAIESMTMSEALKKRNHIATAVLSGARGKKPQAKALISTPGTYSDYKGEPVDYFIRESFADGVRPAAFLASVPGSRSSVISTKSSTARGGDIGKIAGQAASSEVVRSDDCKTTAGIPVTLSEAGVRGRLLGKAVGGYQANTILDRRVIEDLTKKGIKSVLARSPITCQQHNGLCAKCVGYYYNGGKLPHIGDAIGLQSTTTTFEPVIQGALCLAEGTLVKMEEGAPRPIESLWIGAIVIGCDSTGIAAPARVVQVFDQGKQMVRTWKFSNGARTITIRATDEHKVLTTDIFGNNVIRPLKDVGNVVIAGEGTFNIVNRSPEKRIDCYDIEVDHPEHLFVLANGAVVSNSAKHTAGMTQGKKTFAGLDVISQYLQSPAQFPDKAAVADADGMVDGDEDAPQGGKYVSVSGKKYYVRPGMDVLVHKGDKVEAGDQLGDGLVDPEDLVKYKGIGEARLEYARRFGKILEDSGAKTDPRNLEVLARAALNDVRIDDPEGLAGYLPDDVVSYSSLQHYYTPTEDTKRLAPKAAVGQYLQSPVAHYTIGTRVTDTVADNLKKLDINDVFTSPKEPAFKPEMTRLRTTSHNNPDWLARMGTSYIKGNLATGAIRGDDTNIESNENYGPRLGYGVGFGQQAQQTGLF